MRNHKNEPCPPKLNAAKLSINNTQLASYRMRLFQVPQQQTTNQSKILWFNIRKGRHCKNGGNENMRRIAGRERGI
jgi:hypothetical protein